MCTTHRFVQCQACQAVYPAPGPAACPDCDGEADWQPWVPGAQGRSRPGDLLGTLVGLLDLLDGAGSLQDADGKVYDAVVEAVEWLQGEAPGRYQHFYLEEETA